MCLPAQKAIESIDFHVHQCGPVPGSMGWIGGGRRPWRQVTVRDSVQSFLLLCTPSLDPDTVQKIKEIKGKMSWSPLFSSCFSSSVSHKLPKCWEMESNGAVNLLKECSVYEHCQTIHSSQHSHFTGKQMSQNLENFRWHNSSQQIFFTNFLLNKKISLLVSSFGRKLLKTVLVFRWEGLLFGVRKLNFRISVSGFQTCSTKRF